ncbi:MAG: CsgG/HfaB family protein [Desulfuromonadaceae bacterium]
MPINLNFSLLACSREKSFIGDFFDDLAATQHRSDASGPSLSTVTEDRSMKISSLMVSSLLMAICLAGCSQGITMTLNKNEPNAADISINDEAVKNIKTIAVFGFDNSLKTDCGMLPSVCPAPQPLCTYPYADDGKIVAERIAKTLMKTFKFRVIERDRLEGVLKEQAIQISGLTDPEDAVEIGKIIGADAVIYGKVNTCKYGIHYYCQGQQLTQPMGIVNISLKVVSVQTGEIVMLADGELTSYHLLKGPVTMQYTNVLNNPYYYTAQIPGLDAVINQLVNNLIMPLVEKQTGPQ